MTTLNAHRGWRRCGVLVVAACLSATDPASTQTPPPQRQAATQPAPAVQRQPTRQDILRGEYGPYRANNDLLSYGLDVRVDPDRKFISGKNTVRFKMLKDDTRIQLDLYANLVVDKILLGAAPLTFERELNAVFIDFPDTLKRGREYAIDFYYSGTPLETGRFGGIAFRKDPVGRHWINTACEGEGAAIWWPNKDQWRDEVEHMTLSVAIPSQLVDVSNGRFVGKTDLGDGYTRWDWEIHYPINSYNVSLNIGNYVQFSDELDGLTLDYYVLPESLEKAKRQFAQAKPMMAAFKKYFGEYPFKKDGYKLIEAPYTGMEHQSAVTYGNRFENGYGGRDWTGVGVSPKFDFIIIHESAHEWFGNAVSAADVSDMWIQEGWGTYLEGMYVEELFGYDDALKYVNGYKAKVQNRTPIITARGLHRTPPQDMYFKGALFIHTLRSVVDDDAKWWKMVRDIYDTFKYKNIMTEDIVAFFNAKTGRDLTPIFDQYLRQTALPTLELKAGDTPGTVAHRWKADVAGFNLPIKVGAPGRWQVIRPTTDWAQMKSDLTAETLQVATDLYYVNVGR
jgi:aminopeptidase N